MKTKNLLPFKRQEDSFLKPFESIDRALEDLFSMPVSMTGISKMPAVDMKETEKEIIVSVDLPGVDKKDIKLDLTENSLAISCERNESREEKEKGGYHMKEQIYGRFYRQFNLPAAVNTKDARASYKNGVLKINLQKQKPAAKHQITID